MPGPGGNREAALGTLAIPAGNATGGGRRLATRSALSVRPPLMSLKATIWARSTASCAGEKPTPFAGMTADSVLLPLPACSEGWGQGEYLRAGLGMPRTHEH